MSFTSQRLAVLQLANAKSFDFMSEDANTMISVLFSFAITAVGVVSCCGPKKSPRTSSIVHFIFYFLSFEISGGILKNQTIMIGLESFSFCPLRSTRVF